MNNTELTMAERGILEGLKDTLSNAIKKAIEQEQSEKENEEKMPEFLKAIIEEKKAKDARELSFTDFLKIMSEIEDDNDEEDECPWCSCEDCDGCKDDDMDDDMPKVYDFRGMIKEFEEGYKGSFTDGINVYGYDAGTLLEIFKSGIQPADITSDMLTRIYMKKVAAKTTSIDNDDVLAYVLDEDVVNFTLDVDGIQATGTLSCKNGIPSYKIDNQTGMNNSDLILLALFKGEWTL